MTKYVFNSDTLCEEYSGTLILIDPHSSEAFVLSDSSASIVLLFKNNHICTEEYVIATLEQLYGKLDEDTINDITTFIAELERRGIINEYSE